MLRYKESNVDFDIAALLYELIAFVDAATISEIFAMLSISFCFRIDKAILLISEAY